MIPLVVLNMILSIVKAYRKHKARDLSYNALLSGDKLLAKIARDEASQLFSVRLSNLLAVFSSVK